MRLMQKVIDRLTRHLQPVVDEMQGEGLPIRIVKHENGHERNDAEVVLWIEGISLTEGEIRRNPHVSEGNVVPSCRIDFYILDREDIDSILRGWLYDLAALLRQDKDILASDGDPMHASAAFHRGHPILLECAQAWGIDVENIVAPSMVQTSKPILTRGEDGIYTDIITGHVGQIRIDVIRTLNRRKVIVDAITIKGPAPDGAVIEYSDSDGIPIITLRNTVLPEITMEALKGGSLCGLLDGPATAPLHRHVVEKAWIEGRSTRIQIEGGEIALA